MAIIRQSSRIKGSRSQLRSHNEATGSLLAGTGDVDGAGLRQVGGDTQPPSSPTLNNSVISSSQINLSWSASTDNIGVASYTLERSGDNFNWAVLYSGLERSYIDSGLSSGATYYYRVKATDSAGNASAFTSSSATTLLLEPMAWNSNTHSYLSPVKGMAGYAFDWGLTQNSPSVHFYKVTNLNTSGVGSFVDAVTGPWVGIRIVVFETSGVLDLSNYRADQKETNLSRYQTVSSSHGNLIIAGQTAPAGGFWIKGGRLVLQGQKILIWHLGILKTLLADAPSQECEVIGDCLSIGNASSYTTDRVAIVNCAFFYGQDESIDWYSYNTNVSIVQSVISYPIGYPGHHPGGEIHNYGPYCALTTNVDRTQFSRNFCSHTGFRSPGIGAKNAKVCNNVLYNWGSGGQMWTSRGAPSFQDHEHNLFIAGPYTTAKPLRAGTDMYASGGTSIYLNGNRYIGPTYSDSNQSNLLVDGAPGLWSLSQSGVAANSSGEVVTQMGSTLFEKTDFLNLVCKYAGPRPSDRDPLIQGVFDQCLASVSGVGDKGAAPYANVVGYPTFTPVYRALTVPSDPNAAGSYINAAFDFLNDYNDEVMPAGWSN